MEIDFKDIDICNIIKACANSGVQQLSFGQLQISFKQVGIPAVDVWSGMSHTPPVSGTTKEQVQKIDMTVQDRELLEELQETQTMMDDPVQWEQNVIDSFIQQNDGVVDEGSRHNQAESTLS